ncbi:MAG: hypothetical protein RL441_894 [Actinomycetota bacterium]
MADAPWLSRRRNGSGSAPARSGELADVSAGQPGTCGSRDDAHPMRERGLAKLISTGPNFDYFE